MIYIFREQFKTKKVEKEICDICIFSVKLYIKCWFQATSVTTHLEMTFNY